MSLSWVKALVVCMDTHTGQNVVLGQGSSLLTLALPFSSQIHWEDHQLQLVFLATGGIITHWNKSQRERTLQLPQSESEDPELASPVFMINTVQKLWIPVAFGKDPQRLQGMGRHKWPAIFACMENEHPSKASLSKAGLLILKPQNLIKNEGN